ncbi:SH3 domain protein [Aspergillus taichungensis]|uniref:SH3 domain protein n=1 Tax=Aspergillus taichungensis TaxID=482145 RepID=A0A2J5I657_9EURO|nr:SH3 domain protein [Aspergillus taichungensis]
MKDVTSLSDFDKALDDYIRGSYVRSKYVNYLGCEGANLTDTDNFYAQYTTSSICSGLVQSSKEDCDLSDEQSPPLCADTCASMATSEGRILTSKQCPEKAKNYLDQIRSDFTVCALPANSLTVGCISGADNEPKECGFRSNLVGLCDYCRSSSPNSTDSCCTNADAGTRCRDVTLPSASTLPPLFTTTSDASADKAHRGLSGGEIAGIVIGSVAAFALIAALAMLGLVYWRRRRRLSLDSGLNQPNPQRKGSPSMQQQGSPRGFAAVPGGRVTRMSALREVPGSARSRASALFGGKYHSDTSDSEAYGASPGAMSKSIPPTAGRRLGSLSSNSILAGIGSDTTSPRSGTAGNYSSPEGLSSGQSEQLSSFQDYYSQDDMRPGDRVAVLWAYQPRADDEFALDRGEMLKVIGIWDDGWATGIRVPETAEDYDIRHREQRDSGVSNGSQRPLTSPAPIGDIKAFPLVCVCLPQHWRKIIDGGQGDDVV